MGPAALADDDDEFDDEGSVSGESDPPGATSRPTSRPPRRRPPPRCLGRLAGPGRGPRSNGAGPGSACLAFATFLMILLASRDMDLVANLYDNRGSATPLTA